MQSGITVLLTLVLSLFHHGNATLNTTVQADVTPTVTTSVTPTDTPSVTPTDTPSVTPTVTVTDTPTVTPTGTQTATVTPTVTVTPSVTGSPTGTPQGDNDKDDMLGIPANIHALFGLMNAAFHHEDNESRFEAKHGTKHDDK